MIRASLKRRVLLCCTVIFTLVPGASLAEMAHAEAVTQAHLQDRLHENLNQEALILARMDTAFSVASRPHAAYLLHQKSLGLQNNRDRLKALRTERVVLVQEMAGLADSGVVSEALLHGARQSFSEENLRKDSGSPALSFQQARLVSAANASTEKMRSVVLYRMLMAGFLLMVFSLPVIAIFRRGEPIPVRRGLVRVFPMFTVNGAHGRREVLKIQVDTHGKLLHI